MTELHLYGGEQSIASGSTVESQQRVEETLSTDPSPGREVGFFVVQALVLSLAGLFVARRRPALLDNVADSVTNHTVVSGTVGLLASVTLVALFTFMAFTLVLLPVSLLGLLLGVLVVGYGYVVFGSIVGRRLPVGRPDLVVATGVVVVVVALELLGRVPVVGALVQFVFVVTAIGAILITYFGLREFEPVDLLD